MLTFDEEKHLYTWDDKPVPSVTQVLSSVAVANGEGFFESIAGSEHMKSEVARQFGTEFHKIPPLKLSGYEPDFSPEMQPWVDGFDKFVAKYKHFEFIPEYLEYRVYNKRFQYAGTVDAVAWDKEKKQYVVIDWKTATTWQKHWPIQLAAYADSLELGRKTILMPVKIHEGGFQAKYCTVQERIMAFNKWLSILNVYKMKAK